MAGLTGKNKYCKTNRLTSQRLQITETRHTLAGSKYQNPALFNAKN
jgi:hypothetical protein